jgi:hypothetical protein
MSSSKLHTESNLLMASLCECLPVGFVNLLTSKASTASGSSNGSKQDESDAATANQAACVTFATTTPNPATKLERSASVTSATPLPNGSPPDPSLSINSHPHANNHHDRRLQALEVKETSAENTPNDDEQKQPGDLNGITEDTTSKRKRDRLKRYFERVFLLICGWMPFRRGSLPHLELAQVSLMTLIEAVLSTWPVWLTKIEDLDMHHLRRITSAERFIQNIQVHTTGRKKRPLRALIDTGSEVDVIDEVHARKTGYTIRTYNALDSDPLATANGTRLDIVGKVHLNWGVPLTPRTYTSDFFVVRGTMFDACIGYETINRYKLVRRGRGFFVSSIFRASGRWADSFFDYPCLCSALTFGEGSRQTPQVTEELRTARRLSKGRNQRQLDEYEGTYLDREWIDEFDGCIRILREPNQVVVEGYIWRSELGSSREWSSLPMLCAFLSAHVITSFGLDLLIVILKFFIGWSLMSFALNYLVYNGC